jgi:hypothetical protein
MSNTRWNTEDFRHVIEQWKASGLDKKSFCNSQGISYGRFLYWCKRLAETSNAAPSVPSLARLEVISAQSTNKICISGPNGITLHVEAGTDAISFIKALLTA